jgi:Cu-Zn family superoxide dismutase
MKQPALKYRAPKYRAPKYRALVASAVACATIVAAWGLTTPDAAAQVEVLRATLRDPGGHVVGTVTFRVDRHHTRVNAVLRPNGYVAPGAFHGFHVHANNDPANGSGCLADPSQPSTTWFVAVDGHLAGPGQGHGHHDGDMPSPLVNEDGTARLTFTTERIEPGDLLDRAVILHAGPDNFGNVPVGAAPDQYAPNSTQATEKTAKTGNAGDRVACGLISLDPGEG